MLWIQMTVAIYVKNYNILAKWRPTAIDEDNELMGLRECSMIDLI